MSHEVMSDRVRDVGDGIILGFPVTDTVVAGQDTNTVRLYFFRVSRETRYFEQYTALSSIAQNGTSPTNGFDYLGDTGVGSGSDIFRVETDDWHLLHFGLAPVTPGLHVFQAVSPNSNGNPAIDRTGSSEDITPGTTDRGWYTLEQIPNRYDPPKFTERVSFHDDQAGEFLQWAFHNDTVNQLSGSQLNLLITGGGYKVQPVTDEQVQEAMLSAAFNNPENPALDTIYHEVGGVNTYTLGSEEPDSWGEVEDMQREFNAAELPLPAPRESRRLRA